MLFTKKIRQLKKTISKSGLFDAAYYLKEYREARTGDYSALDHYCKFGIKKDFKPNANFDPEWCRELYNNVKLDWEFPIEHYIKHELKVEAIGNNKKENKVCDMPIEKNKNVKEKTLAIKDYTIPKYKYVKKYAKITSSHICLFAHYDLNGIIDDYVIYYLKELAKVQLDIVFITVCEKINDKELIKIKKYVTHVVVRENIGYDFGSWKIGYDYLIENDIPVETLTFVNDSVYGPFNNLSHIYNKMNDKNFDVWGLTDNYYSTYHLQSYFLVFNKKVINSMLFIDFMKSIKSIDDKVELIEKYEIGLSKILSAEFKLGSYISINDVIKKIPKKLRFHPTVAKSLKDKTINVTHFTWDILIKNFKFPFIKIELLRDNPMNISSIYNLELINELINNYRIDYISSHKKRTKKKTKKISGYSIVSKSSSESHKKTICILGSARGGTSMIAGLISIMGVHIGNNTDFNNNEDLDFLQASQPIQGIYNVRDPHHKKVKLQLTSLINKRNNENNIWGWKDPQLFTYFDKIDSSLINPYCIIVYRDPLAIAQKELAVGEYDDVVIALDNIISHRFRNIQKIAKYAKRKRYPLLLISYERSLRDKVGLIEILQEFIGVNLSEEMISKCKDYIQPDKNSGFV